MRFLKTKSNLIYTPKWTKLKKKKKKKKNGPNCTI